MELAEQNRKMPRTVTKAVHGNAARLVEAPRQKLIIA